MCLTVVAKRPPQCLLAFWIGSTVWKVTSCTYTSANWGDNRPQHESVGSNYHLSIVPWCIGVVCCRFGSQKIWEKRGRQNSGGNGTSQGKEESVFEILIHSQQPVESVCQSLLFVKTLISKPKFVTTVREIYVISRRPYTQTCSVSSICSHTIIVTGKQINVCICVCWVVTGLWPSTLDACSIIKGTIRLGQEYLQQ